MKTKRIVCIFLSVLMLGALSLCFVACNKEYENCFDKTYALSNEDRDQIYLDGGDVSSIHVYKKALTKPYVLLNGSTKAKLKNAEEQPLIFNDRQITVTAMRFEAKQKTIDWKGGWDEQSKSVTLYYVADGDYFVRGGYALYPI